MAKGPTFDSITAAFASASKLNANFAAITTSFNNTISRDGSTPNVMAADLDMDSNDILNVSALDADTIVLGGTLMSPSAVAAADTHDFDTRAIVAAVEVSAGFNFVRTSGFATVGDGGAALYKRVGAEPSHNLKVQSLDTTWWELVPDHGYVNVKQAGAKGDNATNDGQAFIDCLSMIELNLSANEAGTYGVIVPPSDDFYYLGTNTLELKRTVHFVGQDIGTFGGNIGTLRWDANITGIIVHRNDTIGVTTEAATFAGQGSVIEGLRLYSDGGTIAGITDDLKGHGIWMRGRATVKNCTITRFPGHGIQIKASVAAGADYKGNANGWILEEVIITLCHQSGVFVDFNDTNVGLATSVDCNDNGRWGFYDSGFLGSTYIACHTTGNGLALKGENGAGESSYVHFGGNLYSANVAASEADLVATEPGTDETVWYFTISGSSSSGVPTWLASQSTGTYFHGGSYRTDDVNAKHLFLGCYTENGQAVAQYVFPSLVIGGFQGIKKGNAITWGAANITGTLKFDNDKLFTTTRTGQLAINVLGEKFLTLKIGGDHAQGMNIIAWDNATGQILIGEHANSGGRRPIRLTTDLSTNKYGRASNVTGGEVAFERGIFVGAGSSARHMNNATVVPSSGEHARGELYWNSAPSVGQPIGWMCTVAGTPGTWVAMANL